MPRYDHGGDPRLLCVTGPFERIAGGILFHDPLFLQGEYPGVDGDDPDRQAEFIEGRGFGIPEAFMVQLYDFTDFCQR